MHDFLETYLTNIDYSFFMYVVHIIGQKVYAREDGQKLDFARIVCKR